MLAPVVNVPINSKDPAVNAALFRRHFVMLMCIDFHPQESFHVLKLMLFHIAYYFRLES